MHANSSNLCCNDFLQVGTRGSDGETHKYVSKVIGKIEIVFMVPVECRNRFGDNSLRSVRNREILIYFGVWLLFDDVFCSCGVIWEYSRRASKFLVI